MSGKELSEALTDISDQKICCAEAAYEHRPRVKRILFRITGMAAILALILGYLFWPRRMDGIITAPGVIKVYAYNVMTMEKRELKNGIKLPAEYGWEATMNAYYGLPIDFEIAQPELVGAEVSLQIQAERGCFSVNLRQGAENPLPQYVNMGRELTVDNGKTVYWENRELENPNVYTRYPGGTDVDVIIWVDGRIVGYVVLDIWMMEDINSGTYGVKLLESAYFPKVDGHFQEITEDYVREQIKAARAWRWFW